MSPLVSNGVLGLVLVAAIAAVGVIGLCCLAEWTWRRSRGQWDSEILPPPDRAATRDTYSWKEDTE